MNRTPITQKISNAKISSPGGNNSIDSGNSSSKLESDSEKNLQIDFKDVQETEKLWHRPQFTREQTVKLLKDKPPGSFLIRDSTSFVGGYGLAIKVSKLQSNIKNKSSDHASDFVRHYLIETIKLENGKEVFQIKGSHQDVVFQSLAVLVKRHCNEQLSLPEKLNMGIWLEGREKIKTPKQSLVINKPTLPPKTVTSSVVSVSSTSMISPSSLNLSTNTLTREKPGTLMKKYLDSSKVIYTCKVLYIGCKDTEKLIGPVAVDQSVSALSMKKWTEVELKIQNSGVMLTDLNRKMFFRKTFAKKTIFSVDIDEKDRKFDFSKGLAGVFGIVVEGSGNQNQCHCFAEIQKHASARDIVTVLKDFLLA